MTGDQPSASRSPLSAPGSRSSMDRRTFLGDAAVLAASAMALPHPRRRVTGRADVVLRRALVYDGSGAPPFDADVAVTGSQISAVGRNLSATATTELDVDGAALAPGFIDIHSHSDFELFIDPRAESKVRQGVTTEVAGQDGGSLGPWSAETFAEVRERYRTQYGVEIGFRDVGGFLRQLEAEPAALNVASMVGHGTIRGLVVGNGDRPATDDEVTRMVAHVEEALRAGACGLSTGLEYVPGAFAPLEEIVRLAGPLRHTGLPYASHMRNEDDHLLAAVEEALNVGRFARVPVHIAHLKAQGERNWWKADAVLQLLERAREDGGDVSYDRYPYVAYATGLSSLFPVWARDGGTEAFLARLGDATTNPRIEREVRAKVAQLGAWDAVLITGTAEAELDWARGRRLGELAASRGEEPYRLLVRIVVADRNRTGMVGFGMSEENTARFLKHPYGMICSDGSALAVDGPLSSGSPHPRSYGTFPRVLGHYVRERRLMPLETAVYKMTGQPARRLRLTGRGTIAAGAAADLVVFDPDRVADRATFERPHQYAVGITHVMVNGEWVLRDGEHTGVRPGQALRPNS